MAEPAEALVGPDLATGVPISSLEEGVPLLGHAGGEAVVLVRSAGGIHAVGANCTHYAAPLADGLAADGVLHCPWHHARFDLRTGAAVRAPAFAPIACWRVEERDGMACVREKRPEPGDAPRLAAAPKSILVVGGGAAAFAACRTLRREGYGGPITLLTAEATGPVDRPNLSKEFLAGKAPEEWIPLPLPDDVTVRTSTRVVAIDAGARRVTTESGETLSADRILLATGAEPVPLAVPGCALPHVFTLRTLADSKAIAAAAEHARHAVVVGAGFIGLEAAASLRERGVAVHVVSPTAPLARVLGEEVGRWLRTVHEEHGVVFHVGDDVAEIGEEAVVLGSGERLDAELVVVGIGVRPGTDLAAAAGLAVDRGILVDEKLETSAKGIFAAGDAARWTDRRTGAPLRIEHWVVAERMGDAAALAMLGRDVAFQPVPFFWSAHYDVTLAVTGWAGRWDSVDVHGTLESRDFTIAYRSDGKTASVVTCGRDRASLEAEAAFERGDEKALAAFGVSR